MKLITTITFLAYCGLALAHQEDESDTLITEFCVDETFQKELYQVDTGQYYTTDMEDGGHVSYGDGYTADEIIEGEGGKRGFCPEE